MSGSGKASRCKSAVGLGQYFRTTIFPCNNEVRINSVSKDKSPQTANHADHKPQRTPEQIQADIAASRERLTQTVGELQVAVKDATNPRNIAKKCLDKAKGIYVSPRGEVNLKNVGITVGVVVGFVVLRKITRRKK